MWYADMGVSLRNLSFIHIWFSNNNIMASEKSPFATKRQMTYQGVKDNIHPKLCYCCSVAKLCPTLMTPWTVARQAPLSMGFPRQEYWSDLPSPPPGDLPDPGIEPTSLVSALQAILYH